MSYVYIILTALLFYPAFCLAELPDSESRPFWTQKTCYLEGRMVYGVGVAMGEKSLENARRKSFEAARREIANFAQLKETTLLIIETQMTYEEMGNDSSFSVWRLVKIPYRMLKKAKTVMKRNKPFYRELVSHITSLEKNRNKELADDLRRAVASGIEESELKTFFQSGSISWIDDIESRKKIEDKILPTGSIVGINSYVMPDEIISLKISAADDEKLNAIFFSIDNLPLKKKWYSNAKIFRQNYSFSTKGLSLGEHRYTFKVTDTSGNTFISKGTFQITDSHNELRRLFLEEFEE
jgi:hypothetical protein